MIESKREELPKRKHGNVPLRRFPIVAAVRPSPTDEEAARLPRLELWPAPASVGEDGPL